MQKLTFSSKNQVAIPKAVRARLGVGSGDRLIIKRLTDSEVVLRKEPSFYDLLGTIPRQPEDAVARIRKLRDEWRQ